MMAPTVQEHLDTARQMAELLDATLAKIEAAADSDTRLVQAARSVLILPLQNALFDLTHLPADVLALRVDSEPPISDEVLAEARALVTESRKVEAAATADLEHAHEHLGANTEGA